MSIAPLNRIRPLVAGPHRPGIRPPTLSWLQTRAPQAYWFVPRLTVNLDARQRVVQRISQTQPAPVALKTRVETRFTTPVTRQLNLLTGGIRQQLLQTHSHTHLHVSGERLTREVVHAPTDMTGTEITAIAPMSLPGARRLDMTTRRQVAPPTETEALRASATREPEAASGADRASPAHPPMAQPQGQTLEFSPPLIGRLTDEVVRHIDRRMRSHRERMGRV